LPQPNRAPLRLVQEDEPSGSPAERSAAEDRELVAAVRNGDAAAAVRLHNRLRSRIDGTIRRILGGSDPDHDDLIQLTLVELIVSIDRFRGDSSLDAWASSVAAHVVYNYLRRRKVERRLLTKYPSSPLAEQARTEREKLAR
jgi:RNA polymerase sigma factor (sigma-70 family)